jgi:hypothetical protein
MRHTALWYLPVQRQSSASHVGLTRVCEQPQLSRPRSTQSAAVDPYVDLLIACKTSVHLRGLSYTNNGGMCVLVVAIPYRRITRGCVVLEAVNDQLDSSGSVRDEDQVKVLWVRVKEPKCPFSNGIDSVPS